MGGYGRVWEGMGGYTTPTSTFVCIVVLPEQDFFTCSESLGKCCRYGRSFHYFPAASNGAPAGFQMAVVMTDMWPMIDMNFHGEGRVQARDSQQATPRRHNSRHISSPLPLPVPFLP